MTQRPAWALSATQAAAAIKDGALTAADWMQSLLDRTEARDETVRGWANPVDRDAVLEAAQSCDAGKDQRPLEGIPIAIKDVINVAGQPTQHGTSFLPLTPVSEDSDIAALMRQAGAIMMGKAVTAEFATYHPGPTRNPNNPAHTPGGSSSGSAALVADCQVPIAIGTQTAGSVIRPASFNGVLGFKPSRGRYPTGGVLETAPSLDTLGLFARTLPDIIKVDAVLSGTPALSKPLARPRIGFCKSPAWPHADVEMEMAFEALCETLVEDSFETVDIELPHIFTDFLDAQALIHRVEASQVMGHIRRDYAADVSQAFRDFIDAGAAESDEDYKAARDCQQACSDALPQAMAGADLLLIPGAPGAAPEGLSATGDPIFQRIWTGVGAPSLGFPAAWNQDGLPLGMQLIAAPGQDRQCLGHAAHLMPYAAFKQQGQ